MNRQFLLYLIPGLLGVGIIFLPTPYEKIGLFVFLASFLALIILGYKVAFRNNKYGMLAQYTHPIKLFTEQVNKSEKIIINLCIILMAGIIFGFLVRSSL